MNTSNIPKDISLHTRITKLFLNKLNIEVPSEDTDLLEAGMLDSLHLVELLFELEQEFKINISLEDLEIGHFCTIAKIAEFVADHQQA
jgi:acyl carrier protein